MEIEPSINYKISTMTASASYGDKICFNLDNIGKYLEIDNSILGIKYNCNTTTILKGEYLTSSYTKSKMKNLNKVKTTLFYNQISIIVKLSSGNIVNVKLFGNGSLHITGVKNENEPRMIMDIIMDKLMELKTRHDTVLIVKDSDGVYLDSNNMIYSQSEPMQIIGYKENMQVYNINKKSYAIDPLTKSFISIKMEMKRTKSILDLNGKYIGYTKIELAKNKLKLYKKNSNIHFDKIIHHDAQPYRLIYYDGENSIVIGKIVYYLDNLNNSSNEMPNCIEYNYSCDPFNSSVLSHANYTVDINCINIFFDLNYQLNRQRLYDKLMDMNYVCEYKPEKYSGVKFIYKLNQTRSGRCFCNSKCVCQNITFLIFQSGNIIVTGCKSRETISLVLQEFQKILASIKTTIQKRIL